MYRSIAPWHLATSSAALHLDLLLLPIYISVVGLLLTADAVTRGRLDIPISSNPLAALAGTEPPPETLEHEISDKTE